MLGLIAAVSNVLWLLGFLAFHVSVVRPSEEVQEENHIYR